jgi:hypothetical protein
VERKIQKWISVTGNPDKLFFGMVLDNETEILDANTSQLEQGKDADGDFLRTYFDDDYAKLKQHLNSKPPFGVPDLKLEGDFHEGFVLRWDRNKFFITSTDEKTEGLVQQYGKFIFGLTDESLIELKSMMLESFIKIFRDELR